MKAFVLILALLMYLMVILMQGKKSIITCISAFILIVVGMLNPQEIFVATSASETLTHIFGGIINWNVLMIYVGSMTIAALFIYSKVPARIADAIVSGSPNTGIAIVAILAMTGIISIFVENVATVLVMAPIALALCKKLKIDPTFFMVGLAVMSNLEGTATLVGDPPSMIFASYAGYTFNDFFFHLGRPSIFFIVQTGMLAGCLFFYAYFARQKGKTIVEKESVISYFPGILLLVMILGLASVSFLPFEVPFLSGGLVMVLGITGIIWFLAFQHKSKDETWELIIGLDWETIVFLIGIFIVVGAVSETGLLTDFSEFLAKITGGNKLAGFILILVVSVVISGFVDNVPYIIVMLPVADSLAQSLNLVPELYMFALLVGSCLGGNLTPFGASANIVAMGILKKEGKPIDFYGWLKIGAPFTFITTGAASLLLWVLYR